mmetsp:Transcript_29215/g.33388  ORF Transcript_29215/g.33388 Transcript_29215/m.33388 type:complete len:93 (+) Transcript_29215:164-442(+)
MVSSLRSSRVPFLFTTSVYLYNWSYQLAIKETQLNEKESRLLAQERRATMTTSSKIKEALSLDRMKHKFRHVAEPYVVPVVETACKWLKKPE